MRILTYHFFEANRTVLPSYDNIYQAGGFSGTETSLLELGKYVLDNTKAVFDVVGLTKLTYTDEKSGITFYSHNDFLQHIQQGIMYDWYIPICTSDDAFHQFIVSHVKISHMIVWLHCCVFPNYVLQFKQTGLDIHAIAVSEWVASHYYDSFPGKLTVIPNGISKDVFSTLVVNKNRGQWCFHATFERGGEAALRTFNFVRNIIPDAARSFHLMSYYKGDFAKHSAFTDDVHIVTHGSLGKVKVADVLQESEYFVYPLVLPSNHVHHDTFACCVLEALAMGVIVVTWNIACIPSLYGDYVVGVDPPAHYPANDCYGSDVWFNSHEATMRLVDAIIALELSPYKKESIRQRGMKWARDGKHNWECQGAKFLNLLTSV